MLNDEELEKYRKVGKLLAEVREQVRPLVKVGTKLVEIAETTEDLIRQKGVEPAFPCNVSVNEIAAHYSPPATDDAVIKEGDVVKVDMGAHLDGYIADTAFTVAIGEKEDLVRTVEQALEAAINVVKPGIDVGEIGKAVEGVAKAAGLKPIRNLTGHSLARWDLHAGLTIPNVDERTGQKLKVGDVIALEPFVTDGAGYVEDQKRAYIFRYLREVPTRLRMSRELLRDIRRRYDGLPFAERWLAKRMSKLRLELTLRELSGIGALWPYYVLAERAGGKVAQAEHTMIVTEQGCEVTTR
ncbi:MAG: type II methionyl aminopeptidase [Hadesarchaea archaeon]|nr:MAG: type II methionyl aminopeptidase [Hadesarchaea archaeon]HDI12678.1 type II methionyl aminopeptidase [Hadesarchaea archaeon]